MSTRAARPTDTAGMASADSATLRRVIAANGWFSIVSGSILAAASALLADVFELPAWVLAVVGVGLVPYGVALVVAARREPFDPAVARLATAADLAWVLAAVVVILVPGTMSTDGKWVLAIVSLAVLDFAVLQYRTLRR